MKRFIPMVLLVPSLAFSAPFDLLLQQRNIADTATLPRVARLATPDVFNVLGTDRFTNLPFMFTLSQDFDIQGGSLVVSQRWDQILNKPSFATVATSGDYNDLTNKPSITGQVSSDWSASSGVEQILNKPSLAAVATSGAYADLSGAPSIPAAQVNSDWAAGSGISQVLNKPTTLAGYGISDAYPLAGNPSAFINQSGARSSVSLTTTGTGGAATYNSSTGALNIPNYAPGTGTITSITAGTGLSGGVITTSGTISLPSVGTSGSYSGVTTDAQGRVSAGTTRSQASATRSLNTVFQVSATRDAQVQYAVQTTITASIAGGQDGDVFLDIASDSGFTANVQSLDVAPCSQTYTLAIALQGVQKCAAQVRGYVPAGYYARIRTVNNTGTPAFSYRLGQETLQ